MVSRVKHEAFDKCLIWWEERDPRIVVSVPSPSCLVGVGALRGRVRAAPHPELDQAVHYDAVPKGADSPRSDAALRRAASVACGVAFVGNKLGFIYSSSSSAAAAAAAAAADCESFGVARSKIDRPRRVSELSFRLGR